MNIEKLDEKRVLFDLCLEDMKLLSIEYNSLNAKSSYNRKIINSLIDIAKIKTGTLHTRYSGIFVEAMPYDGGCFILITINKNKSRKRKYKVVKKEFRCVFSFDSCESMLCAIEKLHKTKPRSSCISKLIYCSGCYHLLLSSLRPVSTAMSHIISEYSGKRSTDKIFISYILEHGKTLEENNAIEKIGTALCKS